MENIILDKKTIVYSIIKSPRKTYAIQIDSKGNVVIKVPVNYNKKYIDILLQQNREWLIQKLERVEAVKKKYRSRQYKQGENFLYLGNSLPLNIQKSPGSSLGVSLREDGFYASVGDSIDEQKYGQYLKQGFTILYKKIARRVLLQKTEYFSKIIGVNFNKIFIKEQKTLWGSCSSINNINYNWKIIMAPERVIDYLVVHELCHIKFRNHSKEYWNEVGKYISDYKVLRQWLKENGILLDLDKTIRNEELCTNDQ